MKIEQNDSNASTKDSNEYLELRAHRSLLRHPTAFIDTDGAGDIDGIDECLKFDLKQTKNYVQL